MRARCGPTFTNEGMLIIHCRSCPEPRLGLATRIESMHRSAEGLVGYVRCPAGHLVVHQFDDVDAEPKAPPSLLELRPRWVDAEQAASGRASGA